MPTKIDKKIVSYKVLTNQEKEKPPEILEPSLQKMSEEFKRPEILRGSTYKLKVPSSEHALYVTINDAVINAGTDNEQSLPYEIFLNSKNMDSFQWITALTRVMSAVFRKGGDMAFLIEELKSTFDPRGGYFKKSKYMPSIVAEIGHVLEQHLKHIGYIPDVDSEQKELMESILKEKEFEIRDKGGDVQFPEHATLCGSCSTKSVVILDGCSTCLNCGSSKCG